MGRPPARRRIGCRPEVTVFKPAGVPAAGLQMVILHLDEVESMRLVDVEEHDHTKAAAEMGVSRATLGRILERGRSKTARALTQGYGLMIEEGTAPLQFAGPNGTPGRGQNRGRHGWRGERNRRV